MKSAQIKTTLIGLVAFCGILLLACKNDKGKLIPQYATAPSQEPAPTNNGACGNLTAVSFSAQVFPAINTKCTLSCHDGSTGIKLIDYSNIDLYANSGQLLGVINGDPNYIQMPPVSMGYPALDSCQIQAIYYWIQQGKLNN